MVTNYILSQIYKFYRNLYFAINLFVNMIQSIDFGILSGADTGSAIIANLILSLNRI